jgi:hypothetical protein
MSFHDMIMRSGCAMLQARYPDDKPAGTTPETFY